MTESQPYKRQWRDYRTATGGRPVKKFLMSLTPHERAAIVAAMKDVTRDGLSAAKHLDGDIYEVKADTNDKFFRVLFAAEGESRSSCPSKRWPRRHGRRLRPSSRSRRTD